MPSYHSTVLEILGKEDSLKVDGVNSSEGECGAKQIRYSLNVDESVWIKLSAPKKAWIVSEMEEPFKVTCELLSYNA